MKNDLCADIEQRLKAKGYEIDIAIGHEGACIICTIGIPLSKEDLMEIGGIVLTSFDMDALVDGATKHPECAGLSGSKLEEDS